MPLIDDKSTQGLSNAVHILKDAENKATPKKAAVIKAFRQSIEDLKRKFQNIEELNDYRAQIGTQIASVSQQIKTLQNNNPDSPELAELKKQKKQLIKQQSINYYNTALALPLLSLSKSIEYFSNPQNSLNNSKGADIMALNKYQQAIESLMNIMKKSFIYGNGIRIGLATTVKLGFETLANLVDNKLKGISLKLKGADKKLTNIRAKYTERKLRIKEKNREYKAKLKELTNKESLSIEEEKLVNKLRINIENSATIMRDLTIKIDKTLAQTAAINSSRIGLGYLSGLAHGPALGLGSLGYLFIAPDVVLTNFIKELPELGKNSWEILGMLFNTIKDTTSTIIATVKDVSKDDNELDSRPSKKIKETNNGTKTQKQVEHDDDHDELYELGYKLGTITGLFLAAYLIGGPLFGEVFDFINHNIADIHSYEHKLHFLKFGAVLWGESAIAAAEAVLIISNLPTAVREIFATKLENSVDKILTQKYPEHQKARKEITEKIMHYVRDIFKLD